jgi:hypothetical protein
MQRAGDEVNEEKRRQETRRDEKRRESREEKRRREERRDNDQLFGLHFLGSPVVTPFKRFPPTQK